MSKKIIGLADGTWAKKSYPVQSNIALLYQCILQDSNQVVQYNAGVGTLNEHYWFNHLRNIWGGMTGEGINQDIKSLYRFICSNYDPGDSIYLFGYSRGAYTVRSLIGMIRKCGIIKKQLVTDERIQQAFQLYREDVNMDYNPGPDSSNAINFRQQYAWHVDASEMKKQQYITFLGVFDTVGDLGIPVPLCGYIDVPKFHDIRLSRIVQQARHALAIDEHRRGFKATLWQAKPSHTCSQQRWFSGDHSDIGGQNPRSAGEPSLSGLTLNWMVRQASQYGLDFSPTINTYHHPQDWQAAVHSSNAILYPFQDYERVIGAHQYNEHQRYPTEVVDESAVERFYYLEGYEPDNLARYLGVEVSPEPQHSCQIL